MKNCKNCAFCKPDFDFERMYECKYKRIKFDHPRIIGFFCGKYRRSARKGDKR